MTKKNTFVFFLIIMMGGFLSYQVNNRSGKTLSPPVDGYVLPSSITRALSLEFSGLISDYMLLKIKTLVGANINQVENFSDAQWDYFANSLESITDIDPYFWETYYFGQTFLTWTAKRYMAANTLLLKARKHLPNNYKIPLYIGFNYYYFLKDDINGAKYIMEASTFPESPPYLATLAARLSSRSMQYRIAIIFLKDMIEQTTDKNIRDHYQKRLDAIQILEMLNSAKNTFESNFGNKLISLDQLVISKIIDKIPEDPYGGEFIIMEDGSIYTTSNLVDKTHKSKDNK